MLGSGKDRTLSILAVVALAALLVLLGVLQYRWSGEISQAASARMQAELQRSMMSFRQALNRDFSEICLRLQPSSEDANEITAEAYYRRLIQWQASAAHSELVSAVYVLEKSGDSAPKLLRLDTEQQRFVEVAAPAEFERLSQQLSRMPFAGRPGPPPVPEGGPPPGMRMVNREAWAMDLSVPALIHSLGSPQPGSGGTSRWLMVELDRQEMEQRLLPELARRNFALSGKFDYDVAVVGGSAGSSGHALYFQPRLYRRTRPGRRSDESFRTARTSRRDGAACRRALGGTALASRQPARLKARCGFSCCGVAPTTASGSS